MPAVLLPVQIAGLSLVSDLMHYIYRCFAEAAGCFLLQLALSHKKKSASTKPFLAT